MIRKYELDIIIPVYNESANISSVLDALIKYVKTPFRVLICYDYEDDNTLPVVDTYDSSIINIMKVKNKGKGVFEAVITGFEKSDAPCVVVLPADDDYNAKIIDVMYAKFTEGCEIVSASRFMKGGCMKGAPFLKSFLVRAASYSLYWLRRIPVHDATNGFRLFSRRVLEEIPIESHYGFSFSLELLVKSYHRGWKICEVPALWFERKKGKSRFRLREWFPEYLRWYFYAFRS